MHDETKDDPENATEDETKSLRAELAELAVPGSDEQASGYNAALRDVLTIFDRHERDRKKRSAIAIALRKRAGKKIGGDLPYGYELAADGETLQKLPAEQQVIAAARRLRGAGHSLREVARRLKTQNMFPREGNEFHPTQIKRMTDEEK